MYLNVALGEHLSGSSPATQASSPCSELKSWLSKVCQRAGRIPWLGLCRPKPSMRSTGHRLNREYWIRFALPTACVPATGAWQSPAPVALLRRWRFGAGLARVRSLGFRLTCCCMPWLLPLPQAGTRCGICEALSSAGTLDLHGFFFRLLSVSGRAKRVLPASSEMPYGRGPLEEGQHPQRRHCDVVRV